MADMGLSLGLGLATKFILGIFAPKQKGEGSKLKDFKQPASEFGKSIPMIFGKHRVSGNLHWSAGIKEIVKKQGGKGSRQTETYKYKCDFAMLFCEGVVSFRKIWFNGELVYHAGSTKPKTIQASARFLDRHIAGMYSGTDPQTPSSYIEAEEGIGNVPGYNGMAYIVFREIDVTKYGNTIPAVSVEIQQLNTTGSIFNDIVSFVETRSGLPPAILNTDAAIESYTKNITSVRGFSGGQCPDVLYDVYWEFCNPFIDCNVVNCTRQTVRITGKIHGAFWNTPFNGESGARPYVSYGNNQKSQSDFGQSGGFCTDESKYTARVISVVRVDGLPDTCETPLEDTLSRTEKKGFIVTQDGNTFRDVIEQIQQVYNVLCGAFPTCDTTTIANPVSIPIKNYLNCGAVVTEVPQSELDCRTLDAQSASNLVRIAGSSKELPNRLSLKYYDSKIDYDRNEYIAHRLDSTDKNDEQSVDSDFVLNANEATQISNNLLHQYWIRSQKFKLKLGFKYLEKISIGTIVEVPYNNLINFPILVEKLTIGADFILEIEGSYYDNPGQYSDSAVPEDTRDDEVISSIATITPQAWDINLAEDAHAQMSTYFTFTGDGAVRGQLFLSNDASNYIAAGDILTNSVVGTINGQLGAASPELTDYKNILTVVLESGTLSSVPESAFMIGKNAALVGSEIIFFRDAVLTAVDTYQISVLARGRRGTEGAIGAHQPNETFVLLRGDVAYWLRPPIPQSEIGRTIYFKAVAEGDTVEETAAHTFQFAANDQKPYAVASITWQEQSGGDRLISWIRRARINGEWVDNVDVPLAEASEAYSIELSSNGTIYRTVTTTSPEYLYSAANQIADTSAVVASVTATVHQISSVVGKGYPKSVTLS